MPVDKVIPMEQGEYPEIDNLPMGSKVSFEGEAELVEGGLKITQIDVAPSDNDATREVNRMAGKNQPMEPASKPDASGF